MSATYVAVRDDSGTRSLTTNEKDFVKTCALGGLRVDGRKTEDIRSSIKIQLGRWDNGAECDLQWGGTRVTSLCTAELVPPNPDQNSSDGMVNFTVDISPMASTCYRQAPAVSTAPYLTGSSNKGPNLSDQNQRLKSNRILRTIERVVLTGGAVDTEALVLVPGKWVWRFTVAITVIDDGGNILDACVLATMAVLRHYRKPQVDYNDENDDPASSHAPMLPTMIPTAMKEASPLPIHHTPLSVSFAIIPTDVAASASSASRVAVLVDPTDREELVKSGTLTVAMNVHLEVCLIDYGGGCELTPVDLKNCLKIAGNTVQDLCHLLETVLTEADDQAKRECLQQLQMHQNGKVGLNAGPPPPQVSNSLYFQQSEESDMEMDVGTDDKVAQHELTTAEEAYRIQALDFASGHVAMAVKEEASKRVVSTGGSLLASMLKSASSSVAETTSKTKQEGESCTPKESKNALIPAEENNNVTEMDAEDSEEETPTTLLSEFHVEKSSTKQADHEAGQQAPATPEEQIDDLAMAVKKKKKKGKTKKG